MTTTEKTYSSLLTPAGSGAIAVIRVTGLSAWQIVGQIFKPVSQTVPLVIENNKLCYGWIVQDGEKIDDVIVSPQLQQSPPFVDISTHAGIRIVERVLGALADADASLQETPVAQAWPADSIIKQEALTALQHSKSKQAAMLSMRLRTGLQPILMNLAERMLIDPIDAKEALIKLKDGYRQASSILHGVSIALVGPPNSGKSTLFNCLLGRSAAIVNERAGTTRDWITGEIEIGGVSISIIDTAGLRVAEDSLENLAISKGSEIATHVDGCILVLDSSTIDSEQKAPIEILSKSTMPNVIAMNKCDLESQSAPQKSDAYMARSNVIHRLEVPLVRCSAITNEGVDLLIKTVLLANGISPDDKHKLSLFTPRQLEAANGIVDLLPKSAELAAKAMVDDLIRPIYQD